jgi:hypothetical protein
VQISSAEKQAAARLARPKLGGFENVSVMAKSWLRGSKDNATASSLFHLRAKGKSCGFLTLCPAARNDFDHAGNNPARCTLMEVKV